ncbi:hypothetical protein [Candidatus Viridilinea mediisalina]|uniref:hypothetical protein n=1 Tax=Candidatus Viridilinea mediisalina TaxID=2024553 RepID=UPI000F5A9068|nr:hypothetical protein [Candidatus Viridilinea mediisalina]
MTSRICYNKFTNASTKFSKCEHACFYSLPETVYTLHYTCSMQWRQARICGFAVKAQQLTGGWGRQSRQLFLFGVGGFAANTEQKTGFGA